MPSDTPMSRRSLAGEQLDGMVYDGADLRGVDFTGASLRGASFVGARLGLPPRKGIVLLAAALILAIAAGLAIGSALHGTVGRLTADAWDEVAEGGILILVLGLFVVLLVLRGIETAIKVSLVVYVSLLALGVLANFLWEEVEWEAAARATLLVIFLMLAVFVGILGRILGGHYGPWGVAFVAGLGAFASGRVDGGLGGVIVAVSLVLVSKRALQGDRRYARITRVARAVVHRWGTRFVDADLTDANFTDTRVDQCDVTGAITKGVVWGSDSPSVPEATP